MTTIATHPWTRSKRDEGDERARDQQLVGQRVHQAAEVRLALGAPRQPAVERVGEAGDHEHPRGQRVARGARQQRGDEHGHQQDAKDREDVRQGERKHAGTTVLTGPLLAVQRRLAACPP